MATTNRRTRKAATTEPAVATPDNGITVIADEAPTTTTPDPGAVPGPEATADTEAAPDREATPDTGAAPDEAPVSAAPASAAELSNAPTSGAPVGSADYMKIVMVAGVLGDHPEGVPAATVVDESGLRAAIVGRVLGAMEVAGAALRKPPAEGNEGVELWLRGEAELTNVDLSVAAVREVCPTCQRPMPRRTGVNTRRTVSTAPGLNSDGQPTLGKGQLEAIVRDFLNAHPGHEFSAGTIGKELGRSSGAVGNALSKLVISGTAVLTNDAPMRYAAPDRVSTTDNATATAKK